MNANDIKILKEDIVTILSSDKYPNGATQTDIQNELRQNWNRHVNLDHKWRLPTGFAWSELIDIAEEMGIKITRRRTEDGAVNKTTFSLK